MGPSELTELLNRAIAGDGDARGALLEQYRPYLVILAARELDPMVSARLSGSDIAQQTCLEAARDFPDFRGRSTPEFMTWLKRILAHNVAEATQMHIVSEKRSVRREHAIPEATGSEGEWANAAIEQSSPSSRAMRDEAAVQLAQALQGLPSAQSEALRLRYIEGWPLVTIAARMERTEAAVASLLKRGLEGLRQKLPKPEHE